MIKLIHGPMRSGKSEKLIEEIEKAQKSNLRIRCYKPKTDTRSKKIESRNGKYAECIQVSSFASIYSDLICFEEETGKIVERIFIDEVQFINACGLKIFIKYALDKDIDVISSGLNLTNELVPFESTAKYAMFCDEVEFVKGLCEICNESPSIFSKCNVDKSSEVLIGDEIYSQTCNKCF